MGDPDTRGLADELIDMEDRWGAHNYRPLDVVVERAAGVWVWDVEGNRYLDCLSAYSALNQGHCHPRIIRAMQEQIGRVTLTSRAFRNDQLPRFVAELSGMCGMEMALPMNTGAEAVESAIKAVRRWGYARKNISPGEAEIIVCENNFHGRTTTIVGFSSEPLYRDGFGPFTPGFRSVPFGDAGALEEAITPNTCAFLFEPIQCEAGILIPPDGYLRDVAAICRRERVLMVADEIQTGLGRTGSFLACHQEGVQPDVLVLGKALSGGVYPVSAVVSSREILGVFRPGSHGSTYGGNPLACAVAREALRVIDEEQLADRSSELGAWLLYELRKLRHPHVKEIRGRGLLVGVELLVPARPYCERLKDLGLLCKETHDYVIRLAPPLTISEKDLAWAAGQLRRAFQG
jgi:ornithine--oxo-acid transaminase